MLLICALIGTYSNVSRYLGYMNVSFDIVMHDVVMSLVGRLVGWLVVGWSCGSRCPKNVDF